MPAGPALAPMSPVWPKRAPGALFVTLEGVDGSGKSTQARALAGKLRATGRQVVETREPGGAPGAEAIRALLVTGDPGRWSAEAEALLFTAARRDHVERVIAPALAQGAVVLCDRYVDSTRAYQGGAEGRALVDALHALAIGLDPDLTLILTLDAESAWRRLSGREAGMTQPAPPEAPGEEGDPGTPAEDRFERKGRAFQQALATAFRRIAEAEPGRCRLVPAEGAPDDVTNRLWEHLEAALGAVR